MSIDSRLVLLLVANALCFWIPAASAQLPVRIELSVDDQDGVVQPDQEVVYTAVVFNDSESDIKGTLMWTVHTVAYDPPEIDSAQVCLASKEARKFTVKLLIPVAGFVDIESVFQAAESGERVSQRRRIGREPERICVPLTRQPDFDEFWEASLDALASIAPEASVEELPDSSNNAIRTYEVAFRSFGSIRVRGWLEVPRSKGPHPAVILLPGYGQDMRPRGEWGDLVVFSFNPRGHGNSQEDVPGEPVDYWIRGLDDKATYYYRGAYLDCVRAVDFLVSRAEVDQERMAVWGESQGGGLAFATAALDPRVDLCVADIPFLCDWVNYFKLTHWPEMDAWIAADEARDWETTLQTLSYFDTMNLAQRIKCPAWMGVGLQDQICPPTTNFATFNRICAPKSFRIYPDRGHGLDQEHRDQIWQTVRRTFGLK